MYRAREDLARQDLATVECVWLSASPSSRGLRRKSRTVHSSGACGGTRCGSFLDMRTMPLDAPMLPTIALSSRLVRKCTC